MLKVESNTGGDAIANQVHHRVWICESCERAPAAFLCKADSASLCSACDADIHSANPLARRHHRVPIQPTPSGLIIRSSGDVDNKFLNLQEEANEDADDEDEDEAASWLFMNTLIKNDDDEQSNDDNGPPPLFGREVDDYLDLDEYNSCQNNHFFNEGYNNNNQQQQQQHYTSVPQSSSYGGDSVVPLIQLGLEAGYSYPASNSSQNICLSSMDVGVVPESTYEVSISQKGGNKDDVFSSPQIQIQLSPREREARVMRYREKKKNRKFEKTIRYASRKAYAETRPRIKGRFAKRIDAEVEVDQMMFSSTSLIADSAYGVVPSF